MVTARVGIRVVVIIRLHLRETLSLTTGQSDRPIRPSSRSLHSYSSHYNHRSIQPPVHSTNHPDRLPRHIHMYTHTHTHTRTHTHTHAHTHAHTRARIHTYAHTLPCCFDVQDTLGTHSAAHAPLHTAEHFLQSGAPEGQQNTVLVG